MQMLTFTRYKQPTTAYQANTQKRLCRDPNMMQTHFFIFTDFYQYDYHFDKVSLIDCRSSTEHKSNSGSSNIQNRLF